VPCRSQVVLLSIPRRRRSRHPTRPLRARIPRRTALRSTTPRQQTATRRAHLITRRLRMLRRNHTLLILAIVSATRLLRLIRPWTRRATHIPQVTTRLQPATARATRVPLTTHPNHPTLRLHTHPNHPTLRLLTHPPKKRTHLQQRRILTSRHQSPVMTTSQSPSRHQPCAPHTTPHTTTKVAQ
jgi:hypothetical protein